MAVQQTELRELLTSEAARERRALKRSSGVVGLIALGGLLWLSFSAYKVVRLGRDAARLNTNIQEQTKQLSQLQTEAELAKTKLDDTNLQLQKAAEALATAKAEFESIAANSREAATKAQARKALHAVTNASLNMPRVTLSTPTLAPPVTYGDPPRRSTPVPQESPDAKGETEDYTRIFSAKEVTQRARVISQPQPNYTEEARRNSVIGTVRLRVVLEASGQVTHITVIQALPYGLTEQAIVAARQLKFEPAKKDGRTVSQYLVIDYGFNVY